MIMKENFEIRAAAREKLQGNWKNPVLLTLLYFVCAGAVSGISSLLGNQGVKGTFDTLLNIFVLAPIGFGYCLYFLHFIRNETDENFATHLMAGFQNYGRTLGVVLLTAIYTFLWFLLFIIPGIIKAYSYAMTYYIALDNPDFSAEACINRSMDMMSGHKFDLFLLDLSFIGWGLLCILTLGIGFLWLVPYIYTSRAEFYMELKALEEGSFDDAEVAGL